MAVYSRDIAVPWRSARQCHSIAVAVPWQCHRIPLAVPWQCHGCATVVPWECDSSAMAGAAGSRLTTGKLPVAGS